MALAAVQLGDQALNLAAVRKQLGFLAIVELLFLFENDERLKEIAQETQCVILEERRGQILRFGNRGVRAHVANVVRDQLLDVAT